MRKMYQTEWLNIQFSDFIQLSSKELAGSEFYQAFYDEFFRRYHDWEQIPQNWLKEKERCANFILSFINAGDKVLSLGCGLGVIERYLKNKVSGIDLSINELAPVAWRWIGLDIPKENQFIGLIPECLPTGKRFDVVYLSAVDYALDDKSLIKLLSDIRLILAKPESRCLVISVSFLEKSFFITREIKTFVKWVLDVFGIRHLGQFWGWNRTQQEFLDLMDRAGYCDIRDGFIDSCKNQHYWISGCRSNFE